MLLAGDTAGTRTTPAMCAPAHGVHVPTASATFPSAHYENLAIIVQEFLVMHPVEVERASFGVAGPVSGGQARITNLTWLIDQTELQRVLGASSVRLLNALDAIAHAVPYLRADDLHTLNVGEPAPNDTIAIVAQGTGLGEAFLAWSGDRYLPFASEGGHADFAPTSPLEIDLLRYLLDRFDHVSYARVCSGRRLPNIYAFPKDRGVAVEAQIHQYLICIRLGRTRRLVGDATYDGQIRALRDAGQPVAQVDLRDRYDVGGEFFRWELATAIAGRRLGIPPFDQPNVESAKQLTCDMVAAYKRDGALPPLTPTIADNGITVYADHDAPNVADALHTVVAQVRSGDYIALHAYVQPTHATTDALQRLRATLRDRTRRATTLGDGLRLLHSTGQLHKGDRGNGVFIQLTADDPHDLPIHDAGAPQSSMRFGVLKAAQSLGDRQTLRNNGRRVIRFHLRDVKDGMTQLTELLP